MNRMLRALALLVISTALHPALARAEDAIVVRPHAGAAAPVMRRPPGVLMAGEMTLRPLATLLALLVAAGPALAQGPHALEREVRLEKRAVRVVVTDEGGGPGGARRVLRAVADALPAVEREAGFPLPREGPVRVAVYATRASCGNEDGYLDAAADTIRVWRGCPDPIVVHEVAHLWFAERFARDFREKDRWLIEGLARRRDGPGGAARPGEAQAGPAATPAAAPPAGAARSRGRRARTPR